MFIKWEAERGSYSSSWGSWTSPFTRQTARTLKKKHITHKWTQILTPIPVMVHTSSKSSTTEKLSNVLRKAKLIPSVFYKIYKKQNILLWLNHGLYEGWEEYCYVPRIKVLVLKTSVKSSSLKSESCSVNVNLCLQQWQLENHLLHKNFYNVKGQVKE